MVRAGLRAVKAASLDCGRRRGYYQIMSRRSTSRDRIRTGAVVAIIVIVVLGLVLSTFQTV